KISLSLIASTIILTIQYFLLIYFNLIGSATASGVQLISKVVVGIFFLYSFPIVFNRSKKKIIIIYFIAVLVFVIHYLIFPENRIYLNRLIFPIFFMNLPALIYSMSIYKVDIFKEVIKKASYIVFIFGF